MTDDTANSPATFTRSLPGDPMTPVPADAAMKALSAAEERTLRRRVAELGVRAGLDWSNEAMMEILATLDDVRYERDKAKAVAISQINSHKIAHHAARASAEPEGLDVDAIENDIRELRGANPGELARRLVERIRRRPTPLPGHGTKSSDGLGAAARAASDGEAWDAAEASLPEGWGIQIIPGQPEAWEATPIRDIPNRRLERSGRGPTPAAALLALAERLSQEPRT